MLSPTGRFDRYQGMPPLSGSDIYCINIIPRQQFTEIIVGGAIRISISRIYQLLGTLTGLFADVAYRHDAYIVFGEPRPHIASALRPHSDCTERDLVAGRYDSRSEHMTRNNRRKA